MYMSFITSQVTANPSAKPKFSQYRSQAGPRITALDKFYWEKRKEHEKERKISFIHNNNYNPFDGT